MLRPRLLLCKSCWSHRRAPAPPASTPNTQAPARAPRRPRADSSALRLRRRALVVWENPGGLPQRALVVKKLGNADASRRLLEIADWLGARGVQVRARARPRVAPSPSKRPRAGRPPPPASRPCCCRVVAVM